MKKNNFVCFSCVKTNLYLKSYLTLISAGGLFLFLKKKFLIDSEPEIK